MENRAGEDTFKKYLKIQIPYTQTYIYSILTDSTRFQAWMYLRYFFFPTLMENTMTLGVTKVTVGRIRVLAWRFEGLHAAVDGDVGGVAPEVELHAVPAAVVEGRARGAHVLGAGAQVEVHVQVPVQQLHRKVVLEKKDTPLKPSRTHISVSGINRHA